MYPKELIEVFCDGTVSRIDDFKKLEFFGKRSFKSKSSQDKGHTMNLKHLLKQFQKDCHHQYHLNSYITLRL